MTKFNSVRFSSIFDPDPKARLSARSGTDGNEVVGQGRNRGKSGSL
ncbi:MULTISPECIES: hypothetical protein [unclassified Arenibacter]|nr:MULTISPECIES: hypothetical protein [unclassified Arenibacter]